MQDNDFLKVYFKGFMADSAQENWIVVKKNYGCETQQFLWKDMNTLAFSIGLLSLTKSPRIKFVLLHISSTNNLAKNTKVSRLWERLTSSTM